MAPLLYSNDANKLNMKTTLFLGFSGLSHELCISTLKYIKLLHNYLIFLTGNKAVMKFLMVGTSYNPFEEKPTTMVSIITPSHCGSPI